MEPSDVFWSTHYTRHNQRRQEHLASLGLQLNDLSVLEVGAGIGDHTTFFLDRQCAVVITEAREQNLAVLRERYPQSDIRRLDLNMPPADPIEADVVYCYGTLYHLEDPARAIEWMSRCAREMLLLETCVSYSQTEAVYPFEESSGKPDDAVSGKGCRPTRSWVRSRLEEGFDHVYVPISQPWHEEFPIDWSRPPLAGDSLIRAVFVASKRPLVNEMLTDGLPMTQVRR